MKLLITGICGFTGERLARALRERIEGLELFGLDNLSRPGSETNVERLRHSGVRFFHGDVRQPSDLEVLPPVDWVIEAAANPSVLAGVDGRSSSRQLLEHNLLGTVNTLEYGATFGFPVWVNRCGVLAGAGQFGTAEQGIFSYWLHAHAARRPLRYIGFGGHGWQVRDAFHPDDLAALIALQIRRGAPAARAIHNAGGGIENSMSLKQLTAWCDRRFGAFAPVADDKPRRFDIPWLAMDSRRVREEFGWKPEIRLEAILEEIARHVRDNPGWLDRCGG